MPLFHGVTSFIRTLLDDIDAATARATLGADNASNISSGTLAAARGGALALGRLNIGGTNYYQMPGVYHVQQVTTQALTANQIRYEPRLIFTTITLDRIAVEQTTAGGAGTTVRLGIYTADSDWNPSTLVLDAGTIAIDGSNGDKAITINQQLTPGRYLFCVNSDGTPTLRNIRANVPPGTVHTGANPNVASLLAAQAYGAFPGTPATPTVALSATGFNNTIYVRVSTP